MDELEISPALVGRQVCNPARPEWGLGRVLRVQSTRVGGQPAFRVSVQFVTGHRTLVVPPARLTAPEPETTRQAGWLDEIGGRTLDDRLVSLPAAILEQFGTPAQRLVALAPLYELRDESAALVQWARRHAHVADPLSHWSRDELQQAFAAFCLERDTHLRRVAALLVQSDGPDALRALLDTLPQHVREAIVAALRRPV
jgi:hypothetical protein